MELLCAQLPFPDGCRSLPSKCRCTHDDACVSSCAPGAVITGLTSGAGAIRVPCSFQPWTLPLPVQPCSPPTPLCPSLLCSGCGWLSSICLQLRRVPAPPHSRWMSTKAAPWVTGSLGATHQDTLTRRKPPTHPHPSVISNCTFVCPPEKLSQLSPMTTAK